MCRVVLPLPLRINMHRNTVWFYTPLMAPAQKELYLGDVGRKRILMNGFYTEGGGDGAVNCARFAKPRLSSIPLICFTASS